MNARLAGGISFRVGCIAVMSSIEGADCCHHGKDDVQD